jgi:predicted AlkP superfamily pyrophosphatase or phosphodiesterase
MKEQYMQEKCKRAFVIGLDGAIGWAVRQAETPNIDALLSAGIVMYSAETVVPSASFEAWGAMFHGVGPEKHQLDAEHPISEDAPWPSFMKVAKQLRPATKCASFSCWAPINTHIIEPSCECHCVSMLDPQLALAAAEYIWAQPPDLYFMQLDFIDAAGHSHGYGSPKYIEQITNTDAHVGIVLDAIRDC